MAAKKKPVTIEPGMTPPEKFDPEQFYGIALDDEQIAFASAVWDKNIDIVMVNSRAGSGKTLVATGIANLLVQYGLYANLIYIMSPYGERKQGWLPGTITEKSSVYFEAFYQALIQCNVNPITAINTDPMTAKGDGYITCITDTFLRGTNLDNAVIIIDEAQNYTTAQLKKVLTRIGSNTKVIVIGHDQQCDLEHADASGFLRYMEHFRGQERAAFCELKNNHRGWISRHADELN